MIWHPIEKHSNDNDVTTGPQGEYWDPPNDLDDWSKTQWKNSVYHTKGDHYIANIVNPPSTCYVTLKQITNLLLVKQGTYEDFLY